MSILSMIDTVIFWIFISVIVLLGCQTPAIVFTGLGIFLIYWIFRSLTSKEGSDRMIGLYVFNIFVCIFLLFFFLTGSPLRRILNSAKTLQPYLKRCEN